MLSRGARFTRLITAFSAAFTIWLTTASVVASDLDGSLGLEHRQYFQNQNGDVNTNLEIQDFELTARAKWQNHWRFRLDFKEEWQPNNTSQSERFWVNPREALVQYKQSAWSAKIGYNTFSWGVTDGVNPLDCLNAHRYQDFLDSEKIGVPSIALEVSPLGHIEFVYTPWQTKTVLPGENSRWLPRDQLRISGVSGYTIDIADSNPHYHYLNDREWNQALENNFGLRWQAQVDSVEFSLVGFEGAGSSPVIVPHANLQVVSVSPKVELALDPNIGLEPNYYRERLVGGSLVATFNSWIIRLASNYWDTVEHHNEVPGWPSWNQENIAGIERSFNSSDWLLTVLVQATYNVRADGQSDSLSSITQLLDRAVLTGLRVARGERFQSLFIWGHDTRGEGDLVTGIASQSFLETWKATAQADWLTGPSGSPLGSYAHNSRFTLGLARSW